MSFPLNAEQFAQKIAKQIQTLPTLPDTAWKLKGLLAKPDCEFDDIRRVLESDPGLCADLIRIANSPFYCHSGNVETLGEAVLTLGMLNLSNFVLVSYSNKVVRSHFGRLKNLPGYFKHSSMVSGAAYQIAKAAGAPTKDQEISKLGGLLHNIGRLVIAVASEQWAFPFGETQKESAERNNAGYEWLDECEVGMMVTRKWNFPEILSEAIGRHHSPVKGDDVNPVALTIYLAELLTIDNLSVPIILSDFEPAILRRMHLSASVLTRAREAYLEGLQQIAASLQAP